MKKNKAMFIGAICNLCITSLFLISCGGSGTSSHSSEDYGEFHNVNTGERQSSYKNSVEQQEDIAILDKMIEEGY